MLLVISIMFIVSSILKFYGFNIIHRIKKISIERSENKKKYDKILSLAFVLVGTVFLVFCLSSSRWFYDFFENELLWCISGLVLFISTCLIIYAPIVYREGIVGGFLSKIEISKKKRKVIYGCYIADAILISVLIIWGIIKCTDYGFPIEFYFLWMDTAIAIFICTMLIIISVLFVIAVTLYKKKVIVFISTVLSLIVFNFSLFTCAWTTGGDYYSFYSPGLKQSIVIEEWTHLITEDVRVYERKNIFFIKKIGSLPIYSIHDFQHRNYDVKWEENKAIITLYKGSSREEICEFVLNN